MQYEYTLQNDRSTRAWERDDYDEVLISTGNFLRWTYMTAEDICKNGDGIDYPFIRTESNTSPGNNIMYNRGGCAFDNGNIPIFDTDYARDPYISYGDYALDNVIYMSYDSSNSDGKKALFIANEGNLVFIRRSNSSVKIIVNLHA